MAKNITINVPAKQYEDHDDCLSAAARDYAEENGLELWQVTAAWAGGEDGERDEIELTVPTVKATQSEIDDAVAEGSLHGTGDPTDCFS